MVTIKCQRLNSEREVEEVEIEVPTLVYSNIENHRELDKKLNWFGQKSMGSKLKCLLLL